MCTALYTMLSVATWISYCFQVGIPVADYSKLLFSFVLSFVLLKLENMSIKPNKSQVTEK